MEPCKGETTANSTYSPVMGLNPWGAEVSRVYQWGAGEGETLVYGLMIEADAVEIPASPTWFRLEIGPNCTTLENVYALLRPAAYLQHV